MAIRNLVLSGIAAIAAACGPAEMPVQHPLLPYNGVEALTNEDFDGKVIDTGYPAVVDFWRERCGACVQVRPVFEKVCEDLAGRVVCGSYDAWQDDRSDPERIPLRYDVRYVPAFRFFCNGIEQQERRFSGYRNEAELAEIMQDFIEGCK